VAGTTTIVVPSSTATLATTADVPTSIVDNGNATAITIDSSEKVNFNQGRLQLGHINKFIDTANYVADAINIGSHPYSNGTIIGQSYPADSPTTIKRTIHTTGTETKFFTVSGATETERVRIDQHGIKFNGDTAGANALDDYEEGTWTPAVTGTTSGSWTTSSTLWYTKIGNVVTFGGYLAVDGESSPVGEVEVDLPFANAGENTAIATVARQFGGSNLYNLTGIVYSAANIRFISQEPSGSYNWIGAGDIDSQWTMWLGGSYKAT